MKLNKFFKMFEQRLDRENIYTQASYWDSKAVELQGNAVSMWPNNHLNKLYHEEQMKFLSSNVPSPNHKKILDLGCGIGRLSRILAAQGGNVTGIDFSEKTLSMAQKLTSGGNPEYRLLSMFELSDVEKYNTVYMWASITVAARSKIELFDLMSRINKALVSDGDVFFLEPIHSGFLHRVLDIDIKEFVRILEESGFSVQFVKPLHFWPMRLILAYVPWPRVVTVPLYIIGQLIMKIPGFRSMG